jgi:WD40 repeat protein
MDAIELEQAERTLSGSGRLSVPSDPYLVLRGHTSPVVSMKVLDGSYLVSGSDKGIIKVWDMEAAREISPDVKAHDQSVQSISKINKSTIFTSGRDGTAKFWELDDGGRPLPYFTIFTGCTHFCNSASIINTDEETNTVCCPSEENQVVLWDTRMRNDVPATIFNPAPLKTGMSMSLLYRATVRNSSHQVICGFEKGTMIIYDVRSAR